MTWHTTAITGAALFALVSQASAQNVAQLTKNGKNVSLNKSKCSRVYTSHVSIFFVSSPPLQFLFLTRPSHVFFTFLQLVINSNDVRFNRGGSHGEGDTDTVKGWINEMDAFETSFNEVCLTSNHHSATPFFLSRKLQFLIVAADLLASCLLPNPHNYVASMPVYSHRRAYPRKS